MLDIQLGRRNLPPAQRLAVMDKFKKKIQEQAALKKEESDKQFYGNRYTGKLESSPNGEQSKPKTHTDKEITKMAGVGTGTVALIVGGYAAYFVLILWGAYDFGGNLSG